MKPLNITIPDALRDKLRKERNIAGISISEIIRRAVEQYFNKRKK